MAGVIDLGTLAQYRPNVEDLARAQVAAARDRLGMDYAEFAEVLGQVLGWTPEPDVVESWEVRSVPPGDVVIATQLLSERYTAAESLYPTVDQLFTERFADLVRIFPSRSAFTAALPPHTLFDGARQVFLAGLSLNLVCQHYADEGLRELIESGAHMRCLFLAPRGKWIAAREQEEDYSAGQLSALTDMNIQILVRLRNQLTADAHRRLELSTYDQPIRLT